MRRLLIVACSATKDPAPGLLPARRRYRGAYWQMINQVSAEELPEILVLSAEFGLISADEPIPDYNRRMDFARAGELVRDPRTGRQFYDLVKGEYAEVYIAAGADYRLVILAMLEGLLRVAVPVVSIRSLLVSSGGLGYQRRDLKLWLLASSLPGKDFPRGGWESVGYADMTAKAEGLIAEYAGKARATSDINKASMYRSFASGAFLFWSMLAGSERRPGDADRLEKMIAG